jgi:hypothetical protein
MCPFIVIFNVSFTAVDDWNLQQQYEWHNNELVYQYAQSSAFTLMAFNIPPRTLMAEFQLDLSDTSSDGVNRSVIL